jgi:hypothetical protein
MADGDLAERIEQRLGELLQRQSERELRETWKRQHAASHAKPLVGPNATQRKLIDGRLSRLQREGSGPAWGLKTVQEIDRGEYGPHTAHVLARDAEVRGRAMAGDPEAVRELLFVARGFDPYLTAPDEPAPIEADGTPEIASASLLRRGEFPNRPALLDAVRPAVAYFVGRRTYPSREKVAEWLNVSESTLERAHKDLGFPRWRDVLAEVTPK